MLILQNSRSHDSLSVIVWESVPEAKRCGQAIWLKLDKDISKSNLNHFSDF